MVQLIREYTDVFAWSYEDMPNLDPQVVMTDLDPQVLMADLDPQIVIHKRPR